MIKDRVLIIWAYILELMITGIIYGTLIRVYGNEFMMDVLENYWRTFTTISGILFGCSVALLIFLGQMLASEFGKYLRWRKADFHYLRAFQIQTMLFFVAAVSPISVALGRNHIIFHGTWLVLLYAGVNGFTVVSNIVGLIRLRQKFRSEYDVFKMQIDEDKE